MMFKTETNFQNKHITWVKIYNIFNINQRIKKALLLQDFCLNGGNDERICGRTTRSQCGQRGNEATKPRGLKAEFSERGANPRRGCLGLLAVHNFCTPFWFFSRKTALRQVVHRDVTRPHFVRSSHLPKSAELAKAILTTINSAIKKSHTRWLLLMAGTTRLS